MQIAVRVDSSHNIGSGHVMRCLALAEMLRKLNVEISFISRNLSGNVNYLIAERGFVVHELSTPITEAQGKDGYQGSVSKEEDVKDTIRRVTDIHADWLIVDHYHFDKQWEEELRPYVDKIMVIDDLADRLHDCDILLDQNYAKNLASRYDNYVPQASARLLGPKYALLRPEFASARRNLKPRNQLVRRVLIFFGAADRDNMTGTALEALRRPEFGHLELDVVIGANNINRVSIERQIAARPGTRLHVQVENIAELMVHADLAVGSAGSTTWERLCLGLPSIVVSIAENQRCVADALHSEGYLVWLGAADKVDTNHIAEALSEAIGREWNDCVSAERARMLVDGQGTNRVSDFLVNGVESGELTIRKAALADCQLYWEWANDREVRSNGFRPAWIPWIVHERWFEMRINDPGTVMFVMESELGPVGQVRFEKKGDRYSIGYSLGRAFRGYGLGQILLERAIQVFGRTHTEVLFGEILNTNRRSARIFEKLGFAETTPTKKGSKRFLLHDYSRVDPSC